MKQKWQLQNPLSPLFLIVPSIFVVELIIMFSLNYLVDLGLVFRSLIDAFFLIIVLFPLLYLFTFRPLMNEISERKKAEQKLIESEEKFQSMFDNSNDAIMLLDQDKFLDCNASTLKIFGYETKTEFLGKHPGDVSPPMQPDGLESHVAAAEKINTAIREGKNFFEWIHRKADGTDFYANVLLTPIHYQGKNILQATVRDISEYKKNENLVKETAERYKAIARSANDAIITADNKGNIIDWNEAATKLFGYSEDEVVGKSLSSIMPEQYKDRHLEGMRRVDGGGEKHVIGKTVELEGLRKDKSTFPIELSLSEWSTNDKHYYTGIIRDISDRKKSENNLKEWLTKYEILLQDLRKFKFAVESTSEQVVITDADGMAIYANSAMEKITGYKIEEAIGRKAGTLWGGYMDKSFYKKLWDTIKIDKKTFEGEIKNKRKNGDFYYVETSISPILDENGNIKFFVAIEKDVTKLKEVDRMKTEFISLASHQLRTPLSAMKWFSEMLLGGDAGKLSGEQEEMVQNIYNSNERMISLVNSLLNISRIESGRIIIDPEPTNLKNLVESIIDEVKVKSEEKKQKIIFEIGEKVPEIKIDPKLIRQVYLNLLTNAIKYSGENEEIKISVLEKGEEIISQIKDNGVGIPENEKDKIFEKFYRASNAIKIETDGSGLGLYLAKAIIMSSGGRIWYESKENEGTSFYFSLPLSGSIAKKGEVSIDS